MKRLLAAILVVALVWSGWWLWISQQRRAALTGWFADRAAAGWVAETAGLSVVGYPTRVDAFVAQPVIADPATGLAWTAEELQILSLGYNPGHFILVVRGPQRLTTGYGSARIDSELLRASFVTDDPGRLDLQRLRLEGTGLAVTPEEGAATRADKLALALDREEGANTYRLTVDVAGLAPPLPPGLRVEGVPTTLAALRADLHVTFDGPLDRAALNGPRPQPARLRLALAEATWGQMQIQAAGQVTLDAEGRPDGRLTVKVANWRDLIALARESGQVPDEVLTLVAGALELLAQLAGNPRALDLPLDLKRGQMMLGPVPLGPAPSLRLRW